MANAETDDAELPEPPPPPAGGNQFNIYTWSDSIPLCDDLWLGMQARNIAMVDMSIVRGIEEEALEAYMERERTPVDILMPLSALSQMWVFSLYEFLRTWRQRADSLLAIAAKYGALPPEEREAFLDAAVKKADDREKMIQIAPRFYSKQVRRIVDPDFVAALKEYREQSDELFRMSEALRVTLAKHEVPKTKGIMAEAPGYGRMSYGDGSMYWFVVQKDGSQFSVNRRALSNAFLGLDDSPI